MSVESFKSDAVYAFWASAHSAKRMSHSVLKNSGSSGLKTTKAQRDNADEFIDQVSEIRYQCSFVNP